MFSYSQQRLNTPQPLTHLWQQLHSLIGRQWSTPCPPLRQAPGDWLDAVLQGGPATAGVGPQREIEEEEDGPGRRGDKAAITEIPQRDTGHGGQASIVLHYAAERERAC